MSYSTSGTVRRVRGFVGSKLGWAKGKYEEYGGETDPRKIMQVTKPLGVIVTGVAVSNVAPVPPPLGTVVGVGYVAQGLVRSLFREKARVYETPIDDSERYLSSYVLYSKKRVMPD